MDIQKNNKNGLVRTSSKLGSTPPITVEFQDLSYSADSKLILKSISGKFCSGELIGILGPSGAGKSTLLNILAGRVTRGVSGSIKINKKPRDIQIFRKLSTYIMQEDLLQPLLSVNEAMMVAAKLKLRSNINLIEKQAIIDEILNTLGLEGCKDTRTERLSGGQRKRLAVALELINNPPVIFLDEPTSGLDTVAIKQCIDVLCKLSGQNRTVICTIHQPPTTILERFHNLYFIANGICCYNGSLSNMVSHLSSLELSCPITYNPAEFIVEIVQSDQEHLDTLVTAIQNGKLNKRRSLSIEGPNHILAEETQPLKADDKSLMFPTSFMTQFLVLYSRMMLQQKRNLLVLWIQLFNHGIAGVLIGVIFYGVGNNGLFAISNFKYCVSIMHFFVYTYVMIPVLLFPYEVQLLKREYYNRWYSLKAYYVALTLRSFPVMFVLGVSFLILTYVLTGQPMEMYRVVQFCTTGIMVAVAAEGLGITMGTIFNIKNGCIVAAAVDSGILVLSVYGMGYGQLIEPFMKILMGISYLRYAIISFCLTLYDKRPTFECSEIYCHYSNPKMLLRDLGMTDTTYGVQMAGLFIYLIFFRLLAFVTLKYRLKPNVSFRVGDYVTKILRKK